MTQDEKDEYINKLGRDLLYYLKNYNELTKVRPHYKKIVDLEIRELINQIKNLSR